MIMLIVISYSADFNRCYIQINITLYFSVIIYDNSLLSYYFFHIEELEKQL